MRFFTALVAGALATVAAAAPAFTWIVPASLEVGQTYNVTYSSTSDAPVSIILRQGASNNLNTVTTLTTTATGGSFLWTVDKALPNGSDYALEIVQGSENNYSKQFIVAGSTSTGLSSSASGSATASVSASASASSSASGSASASSASITGSASASASSSASASNSSVTLSVSGNSTLATTHTSSRGSASATGATSTGTRSTASSTGTATGGATAPTGAAANLKSPMALVFGAVAAMAYLH